MFYELHQKVEYAFGKVFEKYGRFIARHPVKVICTVVIINIALAVGLVTLKTESGIEQYTPTGSTASQNRDQVKSLFTFNTSENFYSQSLPDFGYFGTVIIERQGGGNILDSTLWSDISDVYAYINTTTAYDDSDISFTYADICAKRFSTCVIEGDLIFSSSFISDRDAEKISYPNYTYSGQTVSMDRIVGGAEVFNGYITSGQALRLTFNLEYERSGMSRKWEIAFASKMKSYSSSILSVKYAYSDSLAVETSNSVTGDIVLFSVAFTLVINFSSLALLGSNCVANRYNLALSGVIGTGLAIIGSFGLVSLCGVTFVDIVGVMPFLVLGIGVDDMFVLLSGLAGTSSSDDVETRIGKTMRTSGIAITITSITDVIAFCAGAASVFPSVRNFSWYTGCAILFCYLNYVTFFIGCMTINEKRVSNNLHFWTCKKVKQKEDMIRSGASKCCIICCSGGPYNSRDDIEGPIEKYPKRLIKNIVLFKPAQVFILIIFTVYLGISIWGCTGFKEGLDIRNLIDSESYYYKFYDTDQTLFGQSLVVSLNIQSEINYRQGSTFNDIESLITNVRNDYQVVDDFLISWLHSYRSSVVYADSTDDAFIVGLQSFLNTTEGNVFINDVMIDTTSNLISASRLHIRILSITSSSEQANMMVRIRDIVNSSPLPVFAYSPPFIFFEQYVQIVPQTLQTLGICVGVVFVVTAIFMPLPLVILLVTMTVVMIMVGVIGFIHFWGLTLSSVTMIHIIMCVGFCIDFSTHICHAFVQADGTRNERVSQALHMAGGPIFNGAISTILGVLMLAFSSSYIFLSFFKIMFLVMVFGLVHAMFLLPVVLAYIGPHYQDDKAKTTTSNEEINLDKAHCGGEISPEPAPDHPGAGSLVANGNI